MRGLELKFCVAEAEIERCRYLRRGGCELADGSKLNLIISCTQSLLNSSPTMGAHRHGKVMGYFSG